MAVIGTGNHPKALWPGVKGWWGRQYAAHIPEFPMLFDMESSGQNFEEDVELTGFGLAPIKSEGASVMYDSEAQGVVNRAVHVAYALGYIVTREELDDSLYEIVSKRRVQALAFSMNQTKENVAANVYNRAFNSSYTFGDGVELLATNHPTVTGSQSNELATPADLSEASLEDLTIQIMKATNSKGLHIAIMPKTLILPPDLYYEACRILDSQLRSGTAENDVNALKLKGVIPEVAINHYLTDTDAFFIRTNVPRGMIGYNRVPVEFTKDSDFNTDNALAKAYERYSFSIGDWRGLYGSPGV